MAKDRSRWLADAAAALTHLHAQQPPVIHGDLKPANLVLTRGGRVRAGDRVVDHVDRLVGAHLQGLPNRVDRLLRADAKRGDNRPR